MGSAIFFLALLLAQERRVAPGPVEIRVSATTDNKPLAGVVVRLGGRYAASGLDGSLILDGVPAGRYALTIEEFGYNRHEGQVDLPAGKREPLEVKLTPITQIKIQGRVTADKLPVPGARVIFTPVDIPSAIKGRYALNSHWDGTFTILEIPTGTYRVETSAFGCKTKVSDLLITPALEIVLERDTRRAELAVSVRNSITGAPVAGAALLLDRMAPATTDAQGQALFADLRVGRMNGGGVFRRQAVVTVQAANYEPTLAFVSLDEKSKVSIALNPVDKIVEVEPNDTVSTAQSVRTGAPIEYKIDKNTDRDCFKIRLKSPARLKISTRGPIELLTRLYGSDGKILREFATYPKTDNVIDHGVQAGEYVVTVEEWGNNNSAPDALTLRIDADLAPDAMEPNDTPATARLIQGGEEAGGTLLPVGDADVFRFEMKQPGWVRFTIPEHPLERNLTLRTADGRVVAEQSVYGKVRLELVASLQAGGHTVTVREWGDNDLSTEPYTLRMEQGEGDGRLKDVPLAPNSLVGATVNPIGDIDRYAIALPSAGEIHVRAVAPIELHLRLLDRNGKLLAERTAYPNQPCELFYPAMGPCIVYLEAREWGDNGWSGSPYVLRTIWKPCDELEGMEHAEDVLRGSIMPLGDVDTYPMALDQPGFLEVSGSGPSELHVRILDANRKLLAEGGFYPMQKVLVATEVPAGPCFIDVREWGDNGSHVSPYALKVRYVRNEPEPGGTLKFNEARSYTLNQRKDRKVFFADIPDARKFSIRLKTGAETFMKVDKLWEGGFYANQPVKLDFESKGPTRYRIELTEWGQDGRSETLGYILVGDQEIQAKPFEVKVDPTDPTLVTIDGKQVRYPSEGLHIATVTQGNSVTKLWVDAVGPRERKGIHLLVDYPGEGERIERDAPCRVRAINYSGRPIESVSVTMNGRTATSYRPPFELQVPWSSGAHDLVFTAGDKTVTRKVVVSDYFNLRPEDGAMISGNEVRVSWTGKTGAATVNYRLQGTAAWTQAVGENGQVLLRDLEANKAYEFQPGEGPIRIVTRIKGLAFGRSKYGATINRDYDQKLGISVRNHAEKPMTVRLECGKTEEILVGFVGEGSEGAPFILSPGEEREFWLGLSAQDAMKPLYRFPIRLSGEGYADEAEVEIAVKLPVVKFEWQDAGASGLNRKFRLVNRGDTITDLAVTVAGDVTVSPSIGHGMLQAGESVDLLVVPKLFEGFRGVDAKLTAKSIDKSFDQEVKIALEGNQKIFGVQLTPGGDDLLTARAMAGAWLSPRYLEGKTWENPQDSDGDGKVDRWTIDDKLEGILWVGEDTDGDGKVDFVHADIGSDGQFDYSAYKGEETNLVEAWLELGFKLPWARSAYEKHDLDVVMNGKVVGTLLNVIPEGNHTFKLSPDVIKPQNLIEIQSKHLRGGHYVVGSDFRIKMRLTGSRVWVVSTSQDEARKTKLPGVTLEGADYSVSSNELRQDGDTIAAPVRNVGAARSNRVAVALFSGAVELRRLYADIPLTGAVDVRLAWKAAPGTRTLRVVVDPDSEILDTNRDNNEAMITVTAPGQDAKPTIKLEASAAGTVLSFKVEARDDNGLAKTEIRIDNGMWRLMDADQGKALIQPGDHKITARATDESGNQAEDSKQIRVEASAPAIELEAIPDERPATLQVRADAAIVAIRVNGGAWTKETTVPLTFGKGKVEAMAVAKNGALRIVSRDYTCTKPPSGDEAVLPSRGVLEIEGLGSVDVFGGDPFIFPAKKAGEAQKMTGPLDASGPPGGFVGVAQKQSDWYCTNRPHIKVGFQLPEWVRQLDLPKPGTSEYNAMIQKLLAELRAKGIDTTRFERFQDRLIKKIRTLEGPEGLPGFLESLGFGKGKPKNQAELEEWRDKMQEMAEAWWLRLLASGDPDLIAAGLKARGEAIAKFDQAMQDEAQAIIETIQANQKITEDVLSALPLVGDAVDILALATGESLSGEKVGLLQKIFTTVGLVGPAAMKKLLETQAGKEAFEAICKKAGALTDAGLERLAKALGMGRGQLDETLGKITNALTKERHLWGEGADDAMSQARNAFRNSTEGADDLRRMGADAQTARKNIQNAADAADPDAFHKAVMDIQADKTAQKLIHDADVPDALRQKMKTHIENTYKQVDEGVKAEIEAMAELRKKIADKHGLKPQDVEVDVMTITNVRKPAADDITKIGRDRDVTYTFVTKKPNGTKVHLEDVDHAVSKNVYEKNFWQKTRKDPLPADPSELSKYADKMDQTVTSKWHPEAYNPGEVKLNDFLNKSKQPTLTRVDDVVDTVKYKSDHWFQKAAKSADPTEAAKHTAEGMRQATKQYDDLVMSRVNQYLKDPRVAKVAVPERLQKGIEVFKKVDKGEITAKQAEKMLDALSTTTPSGVKIPMTKEKVVEDMGAFLGAVEKTAGDAYRKVRTKDLMDALSSVPNKGSTAWVETGIQKLNNALQDGHVAGDTFVRLREEIYAGVLSNAASPAAKQGWRDWIGGALQRRLINQAEANDLQQKLQ